MKPSIIFFGSFGHYSALVLKKLLNSKLITISHVVTTPPVINRKGKEKKSPVQKLAEKHNLAVTTKMPISFSDLSNNLKADFIITAGYGKLLPKELLNEPKIASLNLHFSLLPKYRGANPGEWAILMNEKETGITIIEMNDKFDQGGIIYQEKISINNGETRETLYEKLYNLGGEALPPVIVDFSLKKLQTLNQPQTDLPYANRLKRDDGFISWETIKKTLNGETASTESLSELMKKIVHLQKRNSIEANFIERASRALYGFPFLWTIIPTKKGDKRMQILKTKVETGKLILDEVKIEGQTKAKWNQVKNSLK